MGGMGTLGMGEINTLVKNGYIGGKWKYWMEILNRRIYMDTPSVWEVWD
jgi:hypothetical protein